MIELKKEELMKNRGYSATLSAGYHLLADNFKAIFRHVWVYALVFALVMGGWTVVSASMSEDTTLLATVAALLLLVAIFVADIAYYSRVTMLLNDQPQRWNMGRITKLLCVWLLIGVVLATIIIVAVALMSGNATEMAKAIANENEMATQPDEMALTRAMTTVFLMIVLMFAFILPFVYTVPKYLMEPEKGLFATIFGKYGRGMRYWGYIFVCELLLSLCIGVLSIIICLPMYLVQTVQTMNQAGIIGGDESGLPTWFGWLNFGVSTITYFVYAFIGLIEIFVAYYIYGSIETRHRERQRLAAPGNEELPMKE